RAGSAFSEIAAVHSLRHSLPRTPQGDRCNLPTRANMDASSVAIQNHLDRSNARFEQSVLLLQGGGAIGSYQAGVYQAMAEANLHPGWVAGIWIGAANEALIADS